MSVNFDERPPHPFWIGEADGAGNLLDGLRSALKPSARGFNPLGARWPWRGFAGFRLKVRPDDGRPDGPPAGRSVGRGSVK